jgi:hypothetical protein
METTAAMASAGSGSGTGASHSSSTFNQVHYLILLLDLAKCLGIVYYPVTLAYRLCFQPYFQYSTSFINILVIDYIVDVIFICDALLSDFKIGPATIFPEDDTNSVNSEDTISTMGEISWLWSFVPQRKHLLNIVGLFPVELIGFLAGFKYYPWLRLNRMIKCLWFQKNWGRLLLTLEQCGMRVKSGWTRVFLLLFLQCLLCHIGACVYYAMAVDSLRQGNETNWLSKINMVKSLDGGEVRYRYSLGHIYLEAFYFTAQTLVSSEPSLLPPSLPPSCNTHSLSLYLSSANHWSR